MNIELLEMLSKTSGIGGVCLGIYLIIISKTLRIKLLRLFPEKTAAFIVIFTVAMTWSLAGLGLVVWVNSDMNNYINSKVESNASTSNSSSDQKDGSSNSQARSTINIENEEKGTSIKKTGSEINNEITEKQNEKHHKSSVKTMASSISIGFLNTSFTIVFVIFILWIFFIASCFLYHKQFVDEIKK